jgi:hypothetical protein
MTRPSSGIPDEVMPFHPEARANIRLASTAGSRFRLLRSIRRALLKTEGSLAAKDAMENAVLNIIRVFMFELTLEKTLNARPHGNER